MKNGFRILMALVLLALLTAPVFAASGATAVDGHATVSSDGKCQISITASLHLEKAVSDLTFPIPQEARDVVLNGSRVRPKLSGDLRLVDLSGVVGGGAGEYTINLIYTLPDAVNVTAKGTQELTVPLLSGFAYPVENMTFSITLPGAVETRPTFISGYHQNNIEKDMDIQVSGNVISGSCKKALKDRETLRMVLAVSDEMFPRSIVELRDAHWEDFAMILLAVAALVYWLVSLRMVFPKRMVCPEPPEGFSAGHMESILSLEGVDLTMAVMTWAQLGYLQIDATRRERVILRKRMEMGNERSTFEQRCFRNLFGAKSMVDTSTVRYAQLWESVRHAGGVGQLAHPRSGNPKLFRLLACASGLFGGISLGMAVSEGAALQGVWVAVAAILGLIFSWNIQDWAEGVLCWNKQKLWTGLLCGGIWMILGIIGGDFWMAFVVVLGQMLVGLMARFGGRRTEEGKHAWQQVMGLRRYLHRLSKEEVQRITLYNPDYYHHLAAYALALDSDRVFARKFGNQQIYGSAFLLPSSEQSMSAVQWSQVYRRSVWLMDRRRRQMASEKLGRFLRSLRK